MNFENLILIAIVVIIVSTAFFVLFLNDKKRKTSNEQSESRKGIVDRYGYCTKTPKGWGYWLLRLEGYKEPIIIWPHQFKNHDELALTKPGDSVEVRFYLTGDRDDRELIAVHFKNLNF